MTAAHGQPRTVRWRRAAWRWGKRAAIAAVVAWGLGFAALETAVRVMPYPAWLDTPPVTGTWVEDREGVMLAAFVGPDQQWQRPLRKEEISPHLLKAIVAVEDHRFYAHSGVDWQAAGGAAWRNLLAMRVTRGASTLTMQVHRLREPRERSWGWKVEQTVRARQMERRLSKDEILTEYANRAPFGGNLVGAGAASWRYFGKPCAELSLGEAALLAGLPQSPARLRPDRFPERAAERREIVLRRMVEEGMITETEAQEAAAEPVTARWRTLPQERGTGRPAADGALPTLARLADRHAGATVRTTLSARVQRQASEMTVEHLRALEAGGIGSAAVVVLDTQTGEMLAAVSVGGTSPGVDLSVARRSSGSTLKPFIFAAALDAGVMRADSMVDDSPTAWAGYVPSNYDREFRGLMAAGEALAESRNIPAMAALARTGVPRVVGVLEASGFGGVAREPERYGLSLAIGGAEVSAVELAGAYALLGRGGVHVPVRWTAGPKDRGDEVLPAWACWQTLGAISQATRTRAVCPAAVETHVAWKTGTSNGLRDAWCAAVTRSHTVVVWLGNTAGPGNAQLVGTEAAAPLALRLMAALSGPHAPWPAGENPYETVLVEWAGAKPLQVLSLVSPAAGRDIVLHADAPPDGQRVELKATGTTGKVWWFVNDTPVATGDRAWWTPTPGTHEVRVVDEAGGARSVTVRVRGRTGS